MKYYSSLSFSYREEHNVRAGAGSDSGSDAGWGGDKDNEWEKTESNKVGHGGWQDGPQEFKKSGWDEPDSINKDNWTKASPKQNQNRKILFFCVFFCKRISR